MMAMMMMMMRGIYFLPAAVGEFVSVSENIRLPSNRRGVTPA
jgi:hypothetical protein